MHMPTWLKYMIVSFVIATSMAAVKDRIGIGEKIASLTQGYNDIVSRLDRIETKLDKALENKK